MSKTAQALREKKIQRIVELREANVPFRLIARELKVSDTRVRELYKVHFRRLQKQVQETTAERAIERRGQLELLDSVSMRFVIAGSDPATIGGSGLTPRDLFAAIETSRRLKGDLCRLEGLIGGPGGGKADEPAPPPAGGPEAGGGLTPETIHWIRRQRYERPGLYLAIMENYGFDPELYSTRPDRVAGADGERPGGPGGPGAAAGGGGRPGPEPGPPHPG